MKLDVVKRKTLRRQNVNPWVNDALDDLDAADEVIAEQERRLAELEVFLDELAGLDCERYDKYLSAPRHCYDEKAGRGACFPCRARKMKEAP